MNFVEKMQLVSLAKRVASIGGEKALSYFRDSDLRTHNKDSDGFDPVTQADVASEDSMRSYIRAVRPDDTIIGEEKGTSRGSSEYSWVLDPIDGTRAFISGIPVWTVLVSVSKNDIPICGVIHQPFTKEIFVGGFGVSEYIRDGFSLETTARSCKQLKNAFLTSTFPEIGSLIERNAFEKVSKSVKITRYGLDAYAYALLASGHIDIVMEAGLKPYDIQAPISVIEAAGGVVTNWTGGSPLDGGQVLACGDKYLHEKIVTMLYDYV
jgi:histidinol phosphatase-like enzyme (inositol monophosphatase family)